LIKQREEQARLAKAEEERAAMQKRKDKEKQ
jgi:hypothetical protein